MPRKQVTRPDLSRYKTEDTDRLISVISDHLDFFDQLFHRPEEFLQLRQAYLVDFKPVKNNVIDPETGSRSTLSLVDQISCVVSSGIHNDCQELGRAVRIINNLIPNDQIKQFKYKCYSDLQILIERVIEFPGDLMEIALSENEIELYQSEFRLFWDEIHYVLKKQRKAVFLLDLEPKNDLQEPRKEKIPSKADKLKPKLEEYGFFDLPMILALSKDSQNKLLDFMVDNIFYQIAMYDYLGFIDHLSRKYFKTKERMYKMLGKITGNSERKIKGLILVLNQNSNENRNRYKSYLFKEKVIKDYRLLKLGQCPH